MLEALALTLQLGAGLGYSPANNDSLAYDEDFSLHARLFNDSNDFYPWASYSSGDNRILGQNISDVQTVAVGAGYKFDLNDKLYGVFEAGYGYPFHVNDEWIQQEITFTYLVGRHQVHETRPVPVILQGPYDQDSYNSNWDIRGGLTFKAGVGTEINENWSIELNYSFFQPKGLIEIWRDESIRGGNPDGGGWWQEYVTVDMSTIDLRVNYEF